MLDRFDKEIKEICYHLEFVDISHQKRLELEKKLTQILSKREIYRRSVKQFYSWDSRDIENKRKK